MSKQLYSEFFKGNRHKLLQGLSVDGLIIAAAGLVQKSADQAYPFRQDSNFYYLTGINEPDLIVVITKEEEYLIIPDFYRHRLEVIDEVNREELRKISGIEEILDEKEGWQRIKANLSSRSKIATLIPSPILLRHYGIYANPARRQLFNRIKRLFPRAKIVDARLMLARLRMIKQPGEVSQIQKAIDITGETLKDVLDPDKITKYSDTTQIEKAILGGFISRGGQGHAFDPIVAAGGKAAFIHYSSLGEPLKDGQLIVCDVGSSYGAYGADITRTVSYGQPQGRAIEVFEAVKRVQAAVFKLIKPGLNFRTYEGQVEKLVGEELKNLGLITKLNRRSIRRYYPHACSHSLGLDTHDAADYSYNAQENMVITVEPGIYIKEESIGVRIEDVVRITNDGYELMSSHLPTSLKLERGTI